ncbi:MAG: outer membrane beta-barrel protein [Verrucomicrobiia bacterium]|jgi:hypothetical protein
MKKVLLTVGAVVAVFLFVQTAQAQDKPWSVSATVRGFYDDNINTTPSGAVPGKQESFGFEVRPEAELIYDTGQLEVTLGYLYSMKYYNDRANSADHRHRFGGGLKYQINPRANITIDEEFVIAQESEVLDPTGVFTTRSRGNNIRNTVALSALYEMTRLLATEVSYSNNYIDYDDSGVSSRSALLDRVEHRIGGNLRWETAPTTIALVGYDFGVKDQTSNDPIVGTTSSSIRDNRSHYGYVGVDHDFTSKLHASLRTGVQYTEYPNLPAGADDNTINPYADGNISYDFRKGSSIQLGIRHDRSQTDLFALDASASPTLDAETTTGYAAITYGFTAKIQGTVNSQLQYSTFERGAADSSNDLFLLVGANLEYEISRNFSAQAGYSFDRLDSDQVLRSFTRNRVYLGFRATY